MSDGAVPHPGAPSGPSEKARSKESGKSVWGGRLRPFVGAVAVLFLAAIFGLAAYDSLRSYRTQAQAAQRAVDDHARLLAEHAARAFDAVNLTLEQVAAELQDDMTGPTRSPAAIFRDLRRKADALPQLRAVTVLGADGRVLYESTSPHPAHLDLSDRTYFYVHRDHPGLGLFIGRRLVSRSTHKAFVAVSRRVNTPSGKFAGVTTAIVEPEYFHSFYHRSAVASGIAAALVGANGEALADSSADAVTDSRQAGYFSAKVPVRGTALSVVASESRSVALAAWRENTKGLGMVAGVMALVTLGLTALIMQEVSRRARLEGVLRASEERLQTLATNIPGVVFQRSLAPSGRVEYPYLSQGLVEMTGYSSDMLAEQGDLAAMLVHPDDREGLASAFETSAASLQPWSSQFRILDRFGAGHWVGGRGRPRVQPHGQVLWDCVALDISDLKRAEEGLRWRDTLLRLVGEASPFGFLILGEKDAPVVYFNRRLCEIWGMEDRAPDLARGRVSGAEWVELCRQRLPAAAEADSLGFFLLPSGDAPPEGELLLADGRSLRRFSIPVDDDGHAVGRLHIFEDITARKADEKKLRQTIEELARSNEELEQFAYVASHDLQEPLRMVSSYTQLLARRYQGRLDADADEFIGYAVAGAKRMQALIVDLLDYARIGRTVTPFSSFAATDAAAAALATLGPAVRDSQARVDIGPLPMVSGDFGQFQRLLENLIGNAIKYRKETVAPAITLRAQPQGGMWLFTVQDNGIGIEAPYLGRIFLLFQRLHGRETYPGTGIGLAICKKIVERHGGQIWADSVPEAGTTFSFTIPMAGPSDGAVG